MRMRRGQRGQGLAEFALVAPIFLLLVFGVIDFGRGMSADVTVSNSAREGARFLASSVTLNEPSSWPAGSCSSSAVCTLNMACPQGSSSSPQAPPDATASAAGSGQAKAWRQMLNDSLDLTGTNLTMKVSFYKKTNDPANGGTADQIVTCSGFGVAPTYSSTYLPQTGDWVVFDVTFKFKPSTPIFNAMFSQITMDQSATMVLE